VAVIPAVATEALAGTLAGLVAGHVLLGRPAKALAQAATSGSVVFWHTGGVLDAVAAAQEVTS
jgi:hypothetical protein